jgi:flagellar basal-body rod protein FlgC
MQINASGLNLERLKLDTISTNIANANTTRTEDGEAYRRKVVQFRENLTVERNRLKGLGEVKSQGVRVVGVGEDNSDFRVEYQPDHPDADENGYVTYSNVNMVDEMIDLIRTQRSYEANVTALNTSKSILKKALEISKD